MMKVDMAALDKLCDELNRKGGEGMVYSIDSKGADLKINRWSSGIEDLDAIIGGGIPCGRIIEVFGPEGSGKTSLMYYLSSRHPVSAYFPVEGTLDIERAKLFGNRKGQFRVVRSDYGEEAFNKMIQFSKTGIPLICVDSVPSLVPKADVEKLEKAAQKDSVEELQIGGVARLMTKYLPLLEKVIEFTGTTVIFTNQVRDKMKAMMFGEQTDTPGGHKLKHACSLRIQVARRAWIEIPNKDPRNSAEKERVGMIMKMRVVKSKVSNPMGECECPLFFDRGFVSFDDIKPIREELMKKRSEQFGKRKRKEEEDEWDDE